VDRLSLEQKKEQGQGQEERCAQTNTILEKKKHLIL
tara:strand:- start:240 stop:347 length:108 start_codon:yes stop_codon:yes gene_type:complete